MMASSAFSATDCELLLGGQRSGKSRAAEARAADWLAAGRGDALLIATARAGDGEMAARIARHREDRARRVPRLRTLEEPIALPQAIEGNARPDCLLVVDCLTLWLTQVAFPLDDSDVPPGQVDGACDRLVCAVRRARGPLVLVSNEIGLGLISMEPRVRRFVDSLGRLHQGLAAASTRVTLMVAGCEMPVKRSAA
jgi:adenosylcobinamide kinase/adenosylcobinamide-phosphate guanylyltransferase